MIFSGGGGGGVCCDLDFQQIFENFVNLFFRSTEIIFRALPKHGFNPVLAKIEKIVQKVLFRLFLENFNQKKCVFSARALPSKLVYIGVTGAFRKF